MCPSDSTHNPYGSMTESSRTRSDSLEASGSQQDRKRPRLDSGIDNELPSEEALIDSEISKPSLDPGSPGKKSSGGTFLTNSSSPSTSNMEHSSTRPVSKVTINTRSSAGNTAEALDGSTEVSGSIQSSAEIVAGTATVSPGEAAATDNNMVAVPPDTIIIHSSPSQSPEIQIAVVEDIDQDPAETNWAPITRLTDGVLIPQQFNSHYVRRTFPFAQQAPSGSTHEILIDISKAFLQGGERDGFVFIQLKEWLLNFLEIHPHIHQRFVHEEKTFWEEFPDTINSLLRRVIDIPGEARTTDLEDLFVAYGVLTIRFVELDIQLMKQSAALNAPEKLSELYCRPYLPTLALVLQYREAPFYALLHANRGFKDNDLVSSICDRLSSGSKGILPVLTAFLDQLGHVLPRKPLFTTTFVQSLAIAHALARSGTERMVLQPGERTNHSAIVQEINQQVLQFCMRADDLLQSAISKQSPWLTIENSPDVLRYLSRTFHAISEQDAEIAARLLTYVSDKNLEIGHRDLSEIIAYSWKFRTLRKYITAGRMELRVYGMDSMQIDLVQVWKCYTQYNSNSLSVPLVRFLVQFLQDNKMVQYIVGVDSHPQLISRSSNVVGFLVVTGTYCNEDSDVIWRTVKESQDPRTVSEVLAMLKSIFGMQSLPTLMYLCHKLLELPVERYDNRMVDYSDALFHHIREHAHSQNLQLDHLEATPFNVCVRVIRHAIASQTCSPEQKCNLPSWAAENLVRLLAFNIDMEDKRHIWEQCVQDIALKTRFATGSMRALQAWLDVRPDLEVPKLTHDFDFTRLLVEELVDCLSHFRLESPSTTSMQILIPTRLCLLALVAQYAPDTITEDLTEKLWIDVLASHTLDTNLRSMAWDVFSRVSASCKKPNSMVHRLMTDYLPRLDAESLNERHLYFAESSVLYEMQMDHPCDRQDHDVVSLPGINRVWRFVMECPTLSVVNEATNWIIKQYLDHDIVLQCPRRVIEATHLSLLERCLSEVFSAASKLKSFSDGTTSGEDESMVVVAADEEIKSEELRFTRSLLFLRQFLLGVKCRPRYSPPLSVQSWTPPKPFQDRGEGVTINYQVVPIPGRNAAQPLKKQLVIGDQNTVDELAKYLGELTGFTQFTGISAGQKISLIGNDTTVKDSGVGKLLLMVHKVPDTPEKQPISGSRSASSMDAHVMDHFSEFYDLLSLEDHLSKEVYTFLELFPPQSSITELIRAKSTSVTQLLPIKRPYKLLYGLNALRLCVEDEALGSTPDEDFMSFSISSLISVLSRSEATEADAALQLWINHSLVDCLLLALRARVSPITSQTYFSNSTGLVDCIISLAFEVVRPHDIELPNIPSQTLVRQPFAALMEIALHDATMRSELSQNKRIEPLLRQILLVDPRVEVRRAVADVLFGLTGQPAAKLLPHKSADLRSARSRFPAERIEEFLMILWKPLAEILPVSYSHPATSQQLFEVSLAVIRIVGKSMTSTELIAYFQQWASLLIGYDHREIVGKPKEDYVVLGLTNLLQEVFGLTQTLNLDVETSHIAQSIFDNFLYPNTTLSTKSTPAQRIPLLKDTTRGDLYTLVMSFIKDRPDYDAIVEKLDGLVVNHEYSGFAPHIQSERQALRSEVGYAGLRNLSNTCYLNSLFSQLFMNLEFREFVFALGPSRSSGSGKVAPELSKLFASMQNRWDKYVDTTDTVGCIETYENSQIDVSIQMDVDEFFNLLFDRLEGQIPNHEDKNIFRSIYGGQLVQQIKSCECDHISERLEPFSAIQCEIKGKLNLEDSLRAYVEGEVMQGDNKYSCTSCNKHVDAIKRACLKDIPNHLIFNLKRFDFDITTMTRCKVNDEFRFPQSIDMAPYNVESLSNPEESAAPDLFELVGVLVHSGTAESGHYYSYIRERPTSRLAHNSWVQFNDTDVSAFDSQRIGDCCFGGIEHASSLQLSKSHNAYMLFYQRMTSIKRFEATYNNHDPANPVRLLFDPAMKEEIDMRNQNTILSYCLQDPSHARFMRLMLERMQLGTNLQCSKDHRIEDKMIHHALDYIQQISCRFKEMPEFEATCKLLHDYAQKCFACALQVASFFADSDSINVDVQRETALRSAVLRNPNTSVRRSFANLVCEALRNMKKGAKSPDIDAEQNLARETLYRKAYTACVGNLEEPWADMHKFGRAWNDYFDLLSRLTNLGIWEAGVILNCGFLEKIAEIMWADAHKDPMQLRAKYSSYVTLREKGRIFGWSGLIAFLATILEYVQFSGRCAAEGIRLPNNDGFYELSAYEAQLLRPMRMNAKQKSALEWLRRVIMTKQNPNAVTKMVTSLLQEANLAPSLEATLAQGLATETVGDAVAFLDPAITFCKSCNNLGQVQLLVKEALGGIDSIGSTHGKEHLDFVVELADLENEAAGLTKDDFFTMVFRSLKSWAPTLLLFPDDMHYDVRGETLAFLRERLFDPLESEGLDTSQETALARYARGLAKTCVTYIQANHLPRAGKQIMKLEMGQANHVIRIIRHVCDRFYTNGDAADDHFVAEATAVIEHLQASIQEAAETASEDWADNDSVPASDSDAPDFQEWPETT